EKNLSLIDSVYSRIGTGSLKFNFDSLLKNNVRIIDSVYGCNNTGEIHFNVDSLLDNSIKVFDSVMKNMKFNINIRIPGNKLKDNDGGSMQEPPEIQRQEGRNFSIVLQQRDLSENSGLQPDQIMRDSGHVSIHIENSESTSPCPDDMPDAPGFLNIDIDTDFEDMANDENDRINELIRINKLIPVEIPMGRNIDRNLYNNNENFSFIAWYEPTPEFLSILPKEVKERLQPEILALQEEKNLCANAPVKADEAYFDVWRSCSGAVENLTVYPNPASGFINIKYNLAQQRNVEISLHDMNGKVLRTLSPYQTCGYGIMEARFDIKDIPAGMYLVSIRTDSNEQAVQRVIIEN
ncbi:MAG TPA: T9SS type A sorting domain-containing protein, partial [Ignavibacteriales bacterium]|nr:T9SS type A sorting domain-containing protein [Ignavibacteriales bacterium]